MSLHLAIDIGASGGKAFVGEFTSDGFILTEVGRFTNVPIDLDRLKWNMPTLILCLKNCINWAVEKFGKNIDSIGIDTWGVDFGLFDAGGALIDFPTAYRDPVSSSAVDRVFEVIPGDELFARTGIQHLPFNTIFQLYWIFNSSYYAVDNAKRMLLMPGLFTHFMGGSPCDDSTIVSTTQLIDIETGDWAVDIAERLDIPARIFPKIVPPGTIAGKLGGEIGKGFKLSSKVVHTAGHDTAAAVAAFDFTSDDDVYISSGTWFLVGCLSEKALLGQDAYTAGITNERAVDGRFRVLKNVTGFYLMDECRRKWKEEGKQADIERLVERAAGAEPFGTLINPDDSSLLTPGDMPVKIEKLLANTKQKIPHDPGALLRCIFESIAVKTALVLDDIRRLAGINPQRLHIGGGGARNELLCNMLAGATGLEVVAGPIEATAVGNIIVQALALKNVSSVTQGAKMVSRAMPTKLYAPANPEEWKNAKKRFKELWG